MDATRQAPLHASAQAGEPATAGRNTATELKLFTWKMLIAAGVVGTLFLAWQVADALLLVFAGVLLAILFQRIAGLVREFS